MKKKDNIDDLQEINMELYSKFDFYKDTINENITLNIIQKDIDSAIDD